MKHNENFNVIQSRHQTSCSKCSFSFRTQNIDAYVMAQGQVISAHPQTLRVNMVAFEWVIDTGEKNVSLRFSIAEFKYPSYFKNKPIILKQLLCVLTYVS
jgi:hypothetical protein